MQVSSSLLSLSLFKKSIYSFFFNPHPISTSNPLTLQPFVQYLHTFLFLEIWAAMVMKRGGSITGLL
jgi:hypothetical protein